jgi:hypothetical protein
VCASSAEVNPPFDFVQEKSAGSTEIFHTLRTNDYFSQKNNSLLNELANELQLVPKFAPLWC